MCLHMQQNIVSGEHGFAAKGQGLGRCINMGSGEHGFAAKGANMGGRDLGNEEIEPNLKMATGCF